MPKKLYSLSQKQIHRQISKNIEKNLQSAELFRVVDSESKLVQEVVVDSPLTDLVTADPPKADNLSFESACSKEKGVNIAFPLVHC